MAETLAAIPTRAKNYATELMDSEAFDKYWPLMAQELDTVAHIWDRYYTKEYLYRAGMAGEFQTWAVGPPNEIHLVVFTKIAHYPAATILQAFLAFGNDVEGCLPSLVATLEKAVNDTGCDFCDVIGRPGWEKLLPGFKRTSVVLSKSFQHFRVQ